MGGALVTLRTADSRQFASDIGILFIRSDDETNFQLRSSGMAMGSAARAGNPLKHQQLNEFREEISLHRRKK